MKPLPADQHLSLEDPYIRPLLHEMQPKAIGMGNLMMLIAAIVSFMAGALLGTSGLLTSKYATNVNAPVHTAAPSWSSQVMGRYPDVYNTVLGHSHVTPQKPADTSYTSQYTTATDIPLDGQNAKEGASWGQLPSLPSLFLFGGSFLALWKAFQAKATKTIATVSPRWRRVAWSLLSFVAFWTAAVLPAGAKEVAIAISATPSFLQSSSALLAPIFTIGLFAAPLEVLLAIVKAKSVGSYALLPYLTMQINCSVWGMYGLLLGDATMILPNAVGIVVSTLTILTFAYYSTAPKRPVVLKDLSLNLIVLGLLYYLHLEAPIMGLLGAVMSVSLFASPGQQLQQVIQNKDSSSMPVTQIFMGVLCALSWAVYGWCISNLNVLVPNALGFVLSVVQLVIYFKFRKV